MDRFLLVYLRTDNRNLELTFPTNPVAPVRNMLRPSKNCEMSSDDRSGKGALLCRGLAEKSPAILSECELKETSGSTGVIMSMSIVEAMMKNRLGIDCFGN
jgi:hypothetical protein